MSRLFFILHTWGIESAWAATAGDAVRAARTPGGMKHQLAVIDAAFVAHAQSSPARQGCCVAASRDSAPIAALIGTPLASAAGKGGAR